MSVRDERDIEVRRRRPPRWFRLSYPVTAWTKTPQDEHRLLSAVLATLLPREVLSPSELPASLRALGLSMPLTVAGTQTRVPFPRRDLVRPRRRAGNPPWTWW